VANIPVNVAAVVDEQLTSRNARHASSKIRVR